jgi:hypothetical protein
MVDFKGALTQKKQPTREQKEVATANRMAQQRAQWRREVNNPRR